MALSTTSLFDLPESSEVNLRFKVVPAVAPCTTENLVMDPVEFGRVPPPEGGEKDKNDRTVFIGNIPTSCTKKHIKQLLKGRGSVKSIRLRSIKVADGDLPSRLAKRSRKQLVEGSTFNAYAVMSSHTEAENCLGLNGTVLQGRHLRVDLAERKKESSKSIFIGNLPYSADEEKVRELFSVCGEIINVRIVRNPKSGIGKGFGFVTFADKSGVMFALKQHNKMVLDTRTLRVSRSKVQHIQKQSFSGVKSKTSAQVKSKSKLGVATKEEKASSYQCQEVKKKSGMKSTKLDSKSKLLRVTAFRGKRRPDGKKNRYYRLM